MLARHLIVEARKRAGLTQAQLATALGTHQPVVARWEAGRTEPKFSTVVAAVRAAGLELGIHLTPADDHDLALIRRELALLPHERLSRMLEAVRAFDAMEKLAHA
jgi:transcriptional regulator with XRE-family HTH domain